jgi:hypothetical protein
MKRLSFLGSLFGLDLLAQVIGQKPDNSGVRCPVCRENGEELGAVAIGADGRTPSVGDRYFPNVAWLPSLRLFRCRKCGVLYSKETQK